MKRNLILSLVLLLALLAGALAWQQRERALRLEMQVASLSADVQARAAEANAQRELAERLRRENDGYNKEAVALRGKLAQQSEPVPAVTAETPGATASPPPKKGKMSEVMSGMMKDPKMKEMIRQQQGVLLQQIFADFVKEQHLSPQQADQFFDLLQQKQSGAMEEGMKLFEGENKDAAGAEPTILAPANADAEADRQLQMLLGPGNYAAFQNYDKTTGDRMALNQVRQQLALTGTPLGEEQTRTLLQVMMEEGAKSPPYPLASGSTNPRDQMRALSDSNAAEQFYQRQSDLNQRILNRVGSTLKPEQFRALEAFQKQQLEMQKLGIEMAKTMMGGEESAHSTISVVPTTRP